MADPTTSVNKTTINLILMSHTNVGKTTLVRTLLGQDVGEVLDAPDVTTAITSYDLAVGNDGETLRLWDTPGFGDSFRLAKRLKQKYGWWAWLVREVWDRHKNPRLWRQQRVVMDIKSRADAVLYLINSVERPDDAIYVAPEVDVLTWIGKPVLAILNQFNSSENIERGSSAINEWSNALSVYPVIKSALSLDSHTRCWVQELVLYEKIGHILQNHNHAIYARLSKSIQLEHCRRFDASIDSIADYLIETAIDKVDFTSNFSDKLKDAKDWICNKFKRGDSSPSPKEQAMEVLTQRYIGKTKELTDKLIEINRLAGVSAGEIIETAKEMVYFKKQINESASALAGAMISGALTGLGADLVSGGMTLGTGALFGAVFGAAGAAALAKGYNVYNNNGKPLVRWSRDSLNDAFIKSVLLYLAVAHFGRGQGRWYRKDNPDYWQRVAHDSLERYRDALLQLWVRTESEGKSTQTRQECRDILRSVLIELLNQLHPETHRQLQATVSP